jgi:hypothetical protein
MSSPLDELGQDDAGGERSAQDEERVDTAVLSPGQLRP